MIEEINNKNIKTSRSFFARRIVSHAQDVFAISIICILCYLIFFQGLGDYSVRMWDEARLGINALEMLRNGNPIVTYYRGAPEMWNTKPPLFIWIITLSFKLFGINELSLRLPSAAASSLTVLVMYFFTSKFLKDRLTGILACLILFSAFGFSDIHTGRSGDYDALLTLLVFGASILTFIYLDLSKSKYLYFASLTWTLAVMTKGIAAMLITPAILIYIIVSNKIRVILKRRSVIWAIAAFIVTIGAYYLGREYFNAGYLNAVWYEEILNRSTKNNEVGTNPYLYYWHWLSTFRFQHFVYFVPLSIFAYFFVKETKYKNWILFSYLIVTTFYFVISTARGKNLWYDAQLYPFASLLVAIFFTSLIRRIPSPFWIVPVFILSFYLQRYIRTNIAYIQRPDIEKSNSCLKYGYLLRRQNLDGEKVVGAHNRPEFCMPFVFYMEKANIKIKDESELTISDKVLTCDDVVIKNVKKKFIVREFFDLGDGCAKMLLTKD